MSRFGLAGRMLSAWDSASMLTCPTASEPGFDLDEAYAVADEIRTRRIARGERPLGYKIGFTNRGIWDKYGVHAPIWGPVWDSTVSQVEGASVTVSLAGLVQPRIEPEIMFGFARTPAPGMDPVDLAGCIEWVAHGFEIVQSIFPGWQFAAADTIAANGVHGALLVGPRQPVAGREEEWRNTLASFEIDLLRNNELADRGRAENVLDGPLSALRHLVALLGEDPLNPPLTAGEIVTTGTLTRALPVRPGDTWTTRLTGITLAGLSLTLS